MTSSPNSIVLDGYDFESIDPSESKDCIKTHEEQPDLLPIKNDNTSPLPCSNNPAIVKPTSSKEAVPKNDSSIVLPSTEVKYAFLRCLRKLVQTPGLVSWAKNEENDNIFTFSGVKVFHRYFIFDRILISYFSNPDIQNTTYIEHGKSNDASRFQNEQI